MFQDDAGDSTERDEEAYIEELTAATEGEADATADLTEREQQCPARALVETWGMDELQAAGTPEEIATANRLNEVGLDWDRAIVTSYVDNMAACMGNVRDILLRTNPDDPTVACYVENLTESVLRESVVTGLIQEEPTTEVANELQEARAACHITPTVTTGRSGTSA